jgi:hypothetical protein
MLQKISVNQIPDNTCVKIYDPERQKLIAVFENYKKAANKIGSTPTAVQHACARRGRTFSQILGVEVAPRLSAIKEGDLALINHCNKKILLDEKI